MPRGNKKTKKIVRQAKPKKKIVKRAANRKPVKRLKSNKKSGLALKAEAVDLGVKIPVQEIAAAPAPVIEEIEIAEALIPVQDVQASDVIAPAEILDNDLQAINQDQFDDTVIESDSVVVAETAAEEEPVNQAYQQKQFSSRQKHFILYFSLTAIMGVLIVFWGLSIKNSLGQGVNMEQGSDDQSLVDDFQSIINDFQANISNITNLNTNTDAKNQALEAMKNQIETDKIKDDFANRLKEKLENLNANDNVNMENLNTSN